MKRKTKKTMAKNNTTNTLTPLDSNISDTTASGAVTPLGQELPKRAFIEGIPVALGDPRDDPGREAQVAPGQRHHTAADKTTSSPPSRFSLRMSAGWWRSLQYIGMSLHFMASPRPPSPAFSRTIPSTLSKAKGSIELQFYTPAGYDAIESKKSGTTYPVVVNFHGGGFVLGAASDDARFGRQVMETAGAIFVSVDYRLAPEYPFPAAVEDGADALLYLIRNATELRIDPMRMATSGFSAGGNICLTSMLRLGDYKQQGREASAPLPEHRVLATVAWYPIVDYNRSRAERRATCKRPDQALPSNLTDLFDASYLYPVDIDLLNPYVSPFQATDEQLVRSLPQSILIYTCEWDMLQKEGKDFAHRLGEAPISKDVYHKMIRGVPHGWDKSPNPLKPAEQSEKLYNQCCQKLRAIFSNS
ncbi:alpha beta-hydrolase [Ophiostoma piceae UAMH 11346]|uniref:Alpha beta-hydrolase n=1 Tax=Ophiostoma piceae (strain UAMH 11346) TaxID=1262450 RepID=S3C6D7_OPHP1|nr:alpha beta-hydrolase [Ophiostoma piceae UAMH 11346]